MDYILIPAKDKAEMSFLLDLMKKMNKTVETFSSEKVEDIAFITALQKAESSGSGSLAKVKDHLSKIAVAK